MIVKAFSDIHLYGMVIPNIFIAYRNRAPKARSMPYFAGICLYGTQKSRAKKFDMKKLYSIG